MRDKDKLTDKDLEKVVAGKSALPYIIPVVLNKLVVPRK